MKPLPDAGPSDGVRQRGRAEEPGQLAGSEGPPPEAAVVERNTQHADEHEEYVLARGGTVGARARRGDGQGDDVDVARGAQDEEVGVGSVEQAELVVEGSDHAVGEGLGGSRETGTLLPPRGRVGVHGLIHRVTKKKVVNGS